jgi:hypothetical protein
MKSLRALTIFVVFVTASPSAFATGNAIMNVSATVVSKNNCTFKSTPADLDFGTLDPFNPTDRTATTFVDIRCAGNGDPVVYFISAPAGSKMTHTTDPTRFLPFSIAANGSYPREIPPQTHTVQVDGLVRGSDYALALTGQYNAVVTLTVNP